MSSHTNTKKRAVKEANLRVSKLIYCKGFFWQYTLNRAYTEPAPRQIAQSRRAQHLIDIARHELGLPSVEYAGGSWIKYIYNERPKQ